jgi:hypothetical protein
MRSPRSVTWVPMAWLLARDLGEVGDRAVDDLAVASRVSDAHVDDDLRQPGHLVHVREAEISGQLADDLGAVLLLQARERGALGRASGCGVGHC